MSARVVAVMLAVALVSFFAGWILAWFGEPLKGRLVQRWRSWRYARKYRADFKLWNIERPREVDHE